MPHVQTGLTLSCSAARRAGAALWPWEQAEESGLVLTHVVDPTRDYHVCVLLRLQGKKEGFIGICPSPKVTLRCSGPGSKQWQVSTSWGAQMAVSQAGGGRQGSGVIIHQV